MKVNWTLAASEDIEKIFTYYCFQSHSLATNIYNEILDEADRLAFFPTIGFVEPLLSDDMIEFRSFIIMRNFKLIYFISEDIVNITHVWDCRQDPGRLVKRLSDV